MIELKLSLIELKLSLIDPEILLCSLSGTLVVLLSRSSILRVVVGYQESLQGALVTQTSLHLFLAGQFCLQICSPVSGFLLGELMALHLIKASEQLVLRKLASVHLGCCSCCFASVLHRCLCLPLPTSVLAHSIRHRVAISDAPGSTYSHTIALKAGMIH